MARFGVAYEDDTVHLEHLRTCIRELSREHENEIRKMSEAIKESQRLMNGMTSAIEDKLYPNQQAKQ